MKTVYIVSESFSKNEGQGVFKFAYYLYEGLSKYTKIKKIEIGKATNRLQYIYNVTYGVLKKCKDKNGIYLFMCPEYAWASKYLKNSYVIVEDMLTVTFPGERDWKFVKFWKMCWNRAKKQKLISISKATKKEIIENIYAEEFKQNKELYYIPNHMWDSIKNIYLGVDKKQFYPMKNKHTRFCVGYVGGYGKRKNIEMILKVAKLLPDIMFQIAGKMSQTLKNKSLSLNNVLFVGYVDEEDLCKFYNSLDLFLFPNLKEGWGLPVSEAMTCGIIPIVHKDRMGAFEEIIYPRSEIIHADEKTCCGIEVDMNNANEVASSILTLFNKPNEMKRLKSLCLTYSKDFDWNKTVKEYLKYMKET